MRTNSTAKHTGSQNRTFTLTAADKTETARTVTNKRTTTEWRRKKRTKNEWVWKETNDQRLLPRHKHNVINGIASAYVVVCHKTVACCECACNCSLLLSMQMCTVLYSIWLSVAAILFYTLKRIVTHCTIHM